MPVNAVKVQQIIQSGGNIWFSAGDSQKVEKKVIKDARRGGMIDDYYEAKVVIGENDVNIKGQNSPIGADAVNLLFREQYATLADLEAPGYVYSDSFSGCVFYLYRGPMGYIHAVHASRRDGRLIDPTHYFRARGGKLLYKWDSSGKMTDQELMNYEVATVLACIDRDQINVFAFTTKNRKVKRLIEHKVIPGWTTFEEV